MTIDWINQKYIGMKKYFASVCMAIVVILTLLAFCIASCNAQSVTTQKHDEQIIKMEEIINEKEAILDSIEAHFPLLDTIGEGDAYFDLCETRNAFNYSPEFEDKCNHFTVYNKLFDVVIEETMTLLAEYDDSTTFDMVRKMYDNGQWWCASKTSGQ